MVIAVTSSGERTLEQKLTKWTALQGTKKTHISKCVHDAMLESFDPCIYLDELPVAPNFLNIIRCVESTKSVYCRRKCLCSRTRGVPNSFCSSRRRRDNCGAETCTAGKRKIKKTLGGRMAREGGAFMHADDEQRKMGKNTSTGRQNNIEFPHS